MKRSEKIKTSLTLGSLKAIARLPLGMLYGVSDFIYFVLKNVIHYRKKVIEVNLRACFPEKSDNEIQAIRHDFYRHLADLIVESVKLLHIPDKELDKRIEVRGAELVDECAARGIPVMLYLGHYGNWEWVQDISRFYVSDIESYYVYKPLRDHVSNHLFAALRHRFDAEGIEQEGVVRTLLRFRAEKKNFIVGFIADQRPNSANSPGLTTFLGRPTDYFIAAEPLGKRLNARHLYLDVEKTGRGRYRLTFKPIEPTDTETENPITKEYFKMLEATIRRQPPYWLWSHNRWLYSDNLLKKEKK